MSGLPEVEVPGAPPAKLLPGWARAADFLALGLILLAAVIAISGGFRVRIGAWRIALTSPYRILLWALVVAAVRHVIVRQQPVYGYLPVLIARAMRTAPVRAAVPVVVGTRLGVLLAGYLAVFMIGFPGGQAPWRDYENEFMNLQLRWDTGWYLRIAVNGYDFLSNAPPDYPQPVVFFPAYPMSMRALGLLFGHRSPSYVAAGTVLSLMALLFALAYLYAFAREELDEDRSRTALWLLAAYPFALFYSAIYTESFFLLAAVGAFYHFRRQELARAALWGLIAGLTRPNGFLLSVPLGLLAIAPWLPPSLIGGGTRPRRDASIVGSLAAAAMPGIGMLLYSVFVWRLSGDPLAWLAGHAAWGREYRSLTSLVTDRYAYISAGGVYEYVAQLPTDFINALGVIFVLATAWPVARRFGLAYAVFILLNILPPLAMGGLLSAGRFSSVMFPAFLWLAAVVPPNHRAGWIASFAALQAFNAALFYTWRPLY